MLTMELYKRYLQSKGVETSVWEGRKVCLNKMKWPEERQVLYDLKEYTKTKAKMSQYYNSKRVENIPMWKHTNLKHTLPYNLGIPKHKRTQSITHKYKTIPLSHRVFSAVRPVKAPLGTLVRTLLLRYLHWEGYEISLRGRERQLINYELARGEGYSKISRKETRIKGENMVLLIQSGPIENIPMWEHTNLK